MIDHTGRDRRIFYKASDWIDMRFDMLEDTWPYGDELNDQDDCNGDENHDIHSKELSKHEIRVRLAIYKPASKGYIKAMKLIGSWLLHVENLSNWCRCHPANLREAMPRQWYCKMGGFRLICVASEEFGPFVLELAQWSEAILTSTLPITVVGFGKAMILAEFGHARSGLFTETCLRSPWKQLPLRVCGIGHHDIYKALKCAAK